jgi:hypothetical protein
LEIKDSAEKTSQEEHDFELLFQNKDRREEDGRLMFASRI